MFKKIFFWLYATLLALPMVFIGANAIYYGFNDNAIMQEYTTSTDVYYDSNDVTSANDLVIGNIYHFTRKNLNISSSVKVGVSSYVNLTYSQEVPNGYISDLVTPFILFSNSNIYLAYQYGSQSGFCDLYDVISFDFVYNGVLGGDVSKIISCFSKSDYRLLKYHQEVTTNNGIVDSLVEATNRTFEVPMFSWVSSSPITQGLDGLFDLIGMTNTPLLYLIGYWTSISAIMLGMYAVVSVPIVIGRAFNIF